MTIETIDLPKEMLEDRWLLATASKQLNEFPYIADKLPQSPIVRLRDQHPAFNLRRNAASEDFSHAAKWDGARTLTTISPT